MRALMTGNALNAQPQSQSPAQGAQAQTDPGDPPLPPMDNPLAAMLFGGLAGNGGDAGNMPDLSALAALGGAGGLGAAPNSKPKPPASKYQKFAPLVHLVLLWALLGYFVFWFEPKIYGERIVDAFPVVGSLWERWRVLIGAGGGSLPQKLVVQAAVRVPSQL